MHVMNWKCKFAKDRTGGIKESISADKVILKQLPFTSKGKV